MEQVSIREATHVKLPGGRLERIESKWGVSPQGRLAKPSEGGFGVVVEGGRKVGMFEAQAYFKEGGEGK